MLTKCRLERFVEHMCLMVHTLCIIIPQEPDPELSSSAGSDYLLHLQVPHCQYPCLSCLLRLDQAPVHHMV